MTPNCGRFARFNLLSDRPDLQNRAACWRMHPIQLAALLSSGIYVEAEVITSAPEGSEAFTEKLLDHTFCGLKLVQDPLMREDEIHLCDKDGIPLVRIVSVAKPRNHASA